MDESSLKRRVLSASAWSLAAYAAGLVIRFGGNLVMTRLLVPEMFGVMAIATVVMVGLAMFSDLGLKQCIVQSRRGGDAAFLNTAWVLQIIRGFVLCTAALTISVILLHANSAGMLPRESAYRDPHLPWVVGALSFGAIISGFESTKLSEASRNLALGRFMIIDIIAQASGLVCMLAWASVDRSIWALVAGAIFSGVTRTGLSHAWMPGNRNRIEWERPAVSEIVRFGKWVTASSILGFLVTNGDRLVLGMLADTTVIGFYFIAISIYASVEHLLMGIISGVALPALSEVVRSGRELRTVYYRFHFPVASIAYFASGTLITSGDALIHLLYDARYEEAGWMLQMLAMALLTTPLQIAAQCYLALGMPQLHWRVLIIRVAALFAAVVTGFHVFGVPGAIWGIVASHFASLPLFIYYNTRHGIFNLSRELAAIPIVLAGLALGVLVTKVIEV
jgi:O-antigen/teichoic acid export membrane protein